ncbi:MAG: 4Fe-4S binding protein [Clostridia bacterium]|nr:4Fe-4S binding protein [Clostridia bacterium]
MGERKLIVLVEINKRLCKDCGYCMHFCPKKILAESKERNSRGYFYPELTDPDACISCGICATVCPEGAIELPPKGED